MKSRVIDNPNPNATLGFVLFYPFHFYVYKNVYKNIKYKSEFIVDLGRFYPFADQQVNLLTNIIKLLNKHEANYRIIYYEDYTKEDYLKMFFSKYYGLVSLMERGCLLLSCNRNKRKIHMNYGAGKELTMLRPSMRFYDLALAYGKRAHKHLSLYTYCKIVGNPKFDDWFANELDKELSADLTSKIESNKKTLLYLPTHGDLTSMDALALPLQHLSKIYNVVVKLHYYNVYEERERVSKFEGNNIILYDDSADLLPLLKIADVVICDNSSAIFDAILADKPVVVADLLSQDYIDFEHKKPAALRGRISTALTYSGSIEQLIKKNKLVVTVSSPSQLADAIKIALDDKAFFKDARETLRKELFAFRDKYCGKRAASSIEELMIMKKMRQKTPLAQALDAAEQLQKNNSQHFMPMSQWLRSENIKINKKIYLFVLKVLEEIFNRKLYIKN